MATETKSTREQVEELMDKGMEAAQIAEKLGKTSATVYVHIRNINKERGVPSRGRGRPPKVTQDGEAPKAPRPRPGAKASTPKAQATPKRGPGRPPKSETQVKATARTNGATTADEFPAIKAAVEAELSEYRRRVQKLEGMLAAMDR